MCVVRCVIVVAVAAVGLLKLQSVPWQIQVMMMMVEMVAIIMVEVATNALICTPTQQHAYRPPSGDNILLPLPGFSLYAYMLRPAVILCNTLIMYETVCANKGVQAKFYRCIPEKQWSVACDV